MPFMIRCLVLVSTLAAGFLPLAVAQSPKIVVPEEVWDLGRVPQNQEYKHKFRVQNAGTSALEIKQVIPSCQCAAAMPERNRLESGEETTIEVTLKTLTFSGVVHKTVTVQSNDPARPQYQLQVRAEVMPPLFVTPPTLEMGTFSKAEASRKVSFRVVVSPGASVNLKGVSSTSPLLTVEPEGSWTDNADGSRSMAYIAQFKSGAPVGLLRESVWIDTDLPTKPRVDIVAVGSVEGEVTVSPATLNLGRVKAGDAITTSFVVSKSGESDLRIESVMANPAGVFEAAFKELEKGRKYEVTLKIGADAKRGFQKGTVSIKTNVVGENIVQAYFYAFVEK
ncbi:MAG TPA: DUF1573 domain-containing protein [Planctomycetota bacterium]|nr:DUF1573 domain-containing protein [Planctomycetota bacterium]